MDAKFKEVCCNIRACLNSSKRQSSLAELSRDYKSVIGESIPYQSFKYNSLEALIRDVPQLKIHRAGNELFIDVKPDEKTAHISKLVRDQKVAKKKSKKRPSSGRVYRGAPPPRRSFNDAPRNSYNSHNSHNSYNSHSSHRDRQPPPPRASEYYPPRRRDPPPPSRQPVICISSEEEDTDQKILSRYRSSQPSQYDFSDPNEFDDEGSDFGDGSEINEKMDALKVTLDYEHRQVKVNKNSNHDGRPGYHSTISYDDDIGYSSMKTYSSRNGYKSTPTTNSDSYGEDDEYPSLYDSTGNSSSTTDQLESRNDVRSYRNSAKNEINLATTNGRSTGADGSHEMGDTVTNVKRNMTRGPASFLAAGRAMQEPNAARVSSPGHRPRLRPETPSNLLPRAPFGVSNRPGVNNYIRASKPVASLPSLMSSKPFGNPASGVFNKPRPLLSAPISPPSIPQPLSPPILAPAMSPTNSPSHSINIINNALGTSGSKMSDPNMFKAGPHVQPDLSEDMYCGKLHAFTVRHSLQAPVFHNFTKFCPKTKHATYMCKLQIGSSLRFSSCPYESPIITQVQEYVAKIAYEELQRRYETLDTKALSVTADENEIIKRVADIVTPHSTGLRCKMVEAKYKILYQELLPLDWLDTVKNRSLLSVEELLGDIAVYPVEGINMQSDVSKLPPLVLPEFDVWNVFVTCCTSTCCVYFRIVHDDYNGRYETMDEKMLELYGEKKGELKHAEMVKEGSYYAAYLDKSWFRVKALSSIQDDCVRVLLIDHGDIDEVCIEHLFPLDERFTSVPAQKVGCSLTGLEQFGKEPYITKMVYDLTCGKTFVAKVDSRNPHLQLTLFDTSEETDINVNEHVLERIEKELSPPAVPPQNNVTDAYLVSVKEDGLAFVQIISESFKLLKSYLAEAAQELGQNQSEYCVRSTKELVGNKIFLAKYAVDGQWYRVKVNRVIGEDEIEVLFVDYGNLEAVRLSDIADIKHFTDALGMMPHQAVQVKLVKPNDELFTENVIQFIMNLSSSNSNGDSKLYLMKTVNEGVIPDVQMFLRSESNKLVNLNDIIASHFIEYRGPNFVSVELSTTKNNSIKIQKKIDQRNVREEEMEQICPIPNYNVPIREQFSVFVTMVSSPFNFIVQPYDSRTELANLMTEMNNFYEKEQPLVDVANVEEEEAYAVKTDSGKWFRGVVVKVMSGLDCISMKLIDYGDIVSIRFSNLAHLLPCFRILPKQAIKAELAGVVPLHLDWSVEDSLRFKNLVSQKVLISVVVDAHKDGKISIILFDTSTNEEIDIGAVLVEEGRAKDITND